MSETKKIKTYKILSLDGGGIRGVAVARILEEIEHKLEKPIHELFDVVVGTSTGGILSVLMTVPDKQGKIIKAKDAKEFYYHKGHTIFDSSIWRKALSLWVPKYTQTGLLNTVNEIFGADTTLNNAVTNVGLVCTDLVHRKSIVFNSLRAKQFPHDYRHNAKLGDLIRATTAAPTYFSHMEIADPNVKKSGRRVSVNWNTDKEPQYVRDKILLEDGGTTNNNPSHLGYKLAKRLAHLQNCNSFDNVEFKLLSIGTGTLTGKEEDPSINEKLWNDIGGGLMGVVERLLVHDPYGIAMKQYETHCKVMEIFGERNELDNYMRVQFKANTYQLNNLDDTSIANLDDLVEKAEEYIYKHHGNKIYSEEFLKLLSLIEPTSNKQEEQSNQASQNVIQQELQEQSLKTSQNAEQSIDQNQTQPADKVQNQQLDQDQSQQPNQDQFQQPDQVDKNAQHDVKTPEIESYEAKIELESGLPLQLQAVSA